MTGERLPWFPCYPSKLLGALSGMKTDEGYVYWVVCLRIYEVGGPCRDTVEALARRTGMNKRRVSIALDLSFRAGRLVRAGGDGIMNPFAEHVLASSKAHREKLVDAGRAGGLASRQKRSKNQDSEPIQAVPPPQRGPSKLTSTLTEDSLFPNGNRTLWPADYRERFWSKYPRKTEKKAAIAKLDAIMKSGKVDWADINTGIDRYVDHIAQARTEERYIKHPATWLNRGCWDDQYGPRGSEPTRRTGNGAAAILAQMLQTEHQEVSDVEPDESVDDRRALPAPEKHRA